MDRTRRLVRARLLCAALLACALVVPATASAGVTDSLRGWWPMWEGRGQTVYDWSGHANNGRLGSTPGVDANDPTWIRGFFGSALGFDGNDYVRIADTADLRPATVTVSAWVRAPQSPGAHRYVIGKGADGCESASWAIYTADDGGISFVAYDGHSWVRTPWVAPASIWDGRWHHVAGTYDGTTARLFIDGRSTGDSAPSGPISYTLPSSGDTGIGNYLGTCDLYYTGDIAQVAVFGEALPVDQIWNRVAAYFPRPLR